MTDTNIPSSLLTLPRELRDIIYSHLWSSGYILKAQIPNSQDPGWSKSNTIPIESQCLPMKAYYCSNHSTRATTTDPLLLPTQYTDPTWLLTSKLVFTEGIEHLLRHVTWFLDEDDLDRPAAKHAPNILTFPAQIISPIRLEIRTEAWEVIFERLYQCRSLAASLKYHNVEISRLRIVAIAHPKHDRAFSPEVMVSNASHYCGEIMRRFENVDVKMWQLAAEMNLSDQRGWGVYEWPASHHHRVDFDDLEMLMNEHESLHQATMGMHESWRQEVGGYWKDLEDVWMSGRREVWRGEEEVKFGVRRQGEMSSMEFLRARRERVGKIEGRRAVTERLRLRGL